jgi:carboxyl-terminal processing protease
VKNTRIGKALSLAMILAMLLCWLVLPLSVSAADSDGAGLEYLKSVMDMIKERYNGEISDEQLIEGALKGMFDTMDAYTTYFTMEEAQDFLMGVSGEYEGIGISMTKNGDYIMVVRAFPASPAERAGLRSGDKIVTVDGRNIIGISSDEAQSLIIGEAGTKVKLGILRNGHDGIILVEIEREKIRLNPVFHEIRGEIGYIRIESFNSNTGQYIAQALGEMDANNITKIVLDLRDNPGGEVSQAVAVAENFVPEGLITKLDFKSENLTDQEYYSSLENPEYEVAVLVNGLTASASEILAGAIQDAGAGTLIGTKTFGKAKVQSLIPLLKPEAYAAYEEQLGVKILNAYDLLSYKIIPKKSEVIGYTKITTGTYTTPRGRMIDGVGLTPDIEVEDVQPENGINVRAIQKLTVTSKPGLDSEGVDVNNAEKILMLLGYDVDTPDMLLDKKTYDAVWKFRTDNGLYPGGVLDFTTQKLLNQKLEEKIMELDKQYKAAVEVLEGI